MELPRIPDIAARQSIDSTRVFREFVRVRRELESMEGSLFWKKVGDYEYLAHKVKGAIQYKGVRSTATEAELAEILAKKQRLKARHKVLKESVLTGQRMNKAVRAGTVPTEIIDLLTLLEAHGLSDSSLIVGAPALYAYGQSSGVNLPSVKLDGQKGALLPSHPESLHLLIQRSTKPVGDIGAILKKELHQVTEVEVGSSRSSPWLDLVVHFTGVGMKEKMTPLKVGKRRIKAEAKTRVATPERADPTGTASWVTSRTEALAKWLDRTPCFEQVVVGKTTGKMAMMRTLDPKAYVIVLKRVREAVARPAPDDEAALQLRFVEVMIGESMVITKLDDVSQEALERDVRTWAEVSVATRKLNAGDAGARADRPLELEPNGASV